MASSRPDRTTDRPSGPFFRGTANGERFCYLHAPPAEVAVRGGILAVHAFAEEMNKTRAAVADGARALAAAGFVVLQLDLAGCGDSAGDFGDATWDDWLADLDDAWRWLDRRAGAPLWLWGTRLGALLAERFAAVSEPPPAGLLFWQPVVHGAQHLNQFLRLHSVRGMLQRPAGLDAVVGRPKPSTPREDLVAGVPVEIAGYRLGPALATSIDAAQMGRHERLPKRICWLQVAADAAVPLTPVMERLVEKWRSLGSDVAVSTVAGPSFWQTVETERSPALVDATVDLMGA